MTSIDNYIKKQKELYAYVDDDDIELSLHQRLWPADKYSRGFNQFAQYPMPFPSQDHT